MRKSQKVIHGVSPVTKNTSVSSAHKRVPYPYKKMYSKFIEKSVSGKLSFADARYILGSHFRIRKDECHSILKEMQDLGLLQLYPYHFVKLHRRGAEE